MTRKLAVNLVPYPTYTKVGFTMGENPICATGCSENGKRESYVLRAKCSTIRAVNDMQDHHKRKADFPMITQPLHLNPNKGDRPFGALWAR